MLGVVGILISLGLLMFLAYRGVSVILLAPVLALVACLFQADGVPLLATYTQVFMPAMGDFAARYFPIFLLGAIFGKLMQDSGCARSIALQFRDWLGERHAVLSIVLACGLLEYGGVSAFVVAFSVYPLAAALFRELDIPKRLLGGTLALGAFTFAMTALPGTAQIHNVIPMSYFGTTAFAAPVLGLTAATMMVGGGVLWLNLRLRAARRAGEGYGTGHTREPEAIDGEVPGFWTALLPIIAVIGINLIMVRYVMPGWDTSYLGTDAYGNTDFESVRGLWGIIPALLVAGLLVAAVHFRSRARLNRTLTDGAMGSLLPMFNTASEVGYGTTIATLAAFAVVKESVLNISPGNPLISEMVAVNVLAGITGSASGGLGIALSALGETYNELAATLGVNPEYMHRIASMSSGGFDSLPHNGAVITLLTICGLTHRQAYPDIAIVSLLIPFLVTATCVAALSLIL
ncbi:GntP family permease [Spectribacter hydrogenoxidans]|uniref:GntP family permease n=1 Tax=Spectribacter hydrogenoxidans TaxID=3075608 RepID=A0ABU3BZU0_9GAMM|nr:GntP family permease [Salinisphaera sp. W335]MDT0634828.1 GntP family permease [Salinisphaera sp. W335]